MHCIYACVVARAVYVGQGAAVAAEGADPQGLQGVPQVGAYMLVPFL